MKRTTVWGELGGRTGEAHTAPPISQEIVADECGCLVIRGVLVTFQVILSRAFTTQITNVLMPAAAHSYQYSFSPNPHWSKFYAPAHEIRAYLQSVADKYSVNRFVKCSHKVIACTWEQDRGKW